MARLNQPRSPAGSPTRGCGTTGSASAPPLRRRCRRYGPFPASSLGNHNKGTQAWRVATPFRKRRRSVLHLPGQSPFEHERRARVCPDEDHLRAVVPARLRSTDPQTVTGKTHGGCCPLHSSSPLCSRTRRRPPPALRSQTLVPHRNRHLPKERTSHARRRAFLCRGDLGSTVTNGLTDAFRGASRACRGR
jgi:hypothetical protein